MIGTETNFKRIQTSTLIRKQGEALMTPRLQFVLRNTVAAEAAKAFSTGYRERGDTIGEAITVADRCEPGRRLTADEVEAIQVVIDSCVAWQRGEEFARKICGFITTGQVTRARRSYAPNPKLYSNKGGSQ
ncbi:MAG: hypothetical protein Q8M24_15520 [Pseudolabrys sp.]|nr:hypothetical protein [Pseudolabrys sp.]